MRQLSHSIFLNTVCGETKSLISSKHGLWDKEVTHLLWSRFVGQLSRSVVCQKISYLLYMNTVYRIICSRSFHNSLMITPWFVWFFYFYHIFRKPNSWKRLHVSDKSRKSSVQEWAKTLKSGCNFLYFKYFD